MSERCHSPSAPGGKNLMSGKPLRARFRRSELCPIRICRISAINLEARCSGSTSFKKVRLGSVLAITQRLLNISPFSSSTPTVRPFSIIIFFTAASVRISTPFDLAKPAMAWVNAPMPPLTSRQAPFSPSISPMAAWKNGMAEPGWRRLAKFPEKQAEAYMDFTIGLSNQCSMKSWALPVSIWIRRYRISGESLRTSRPILNIANKSWKPASSLGGSRSIWLRTTSPMVCTMASNCNMAS